MAGAGQTALRSTRRSTRSSAGALFLSGMVPLVARPVLFAAAEAVYDIDAGVAVGSFIAVLLLFSVPVTLLGCVSPFAIKLALRGLENAGQTVGGLYAVSTFGSIIGTFAPVLYLIPEAGTALTFLIFAGFLLVVGLVGLFMSARGAALRLAWMPFVLAIFAALILGNTQRPVPAGYRLLYATDSAYNYIQIVEDANGYRYLWLNEGQGIHSQYHPTDYYYRRTWGLFLAGPYFNPGFTPDQMGPVALVGLAGGTIARQHSAVYGPIPIDGIEIDGDIVAASRRYLGMDLPNLNTIVGDARYEFRQLEGPYSMVGLDAYRVPMCLQLTTVEFFEEVRERLAEDGVVVINVGRTPDDRRLEEAIARTLLEVFPSVHRIDVPDSLNTILVATRQPTDPANLAANRARLDPVPHPLLAEVLTDAVAGQRPITPSDLVFTDDRAPVETLINDMTLQYLLNGNIEELRP
ncbi:MAG: fused MFS/spermidine synthase [Anaerolineae bacterium]|nr:fused MFS/spermidine synthase [Anaerolineae bacterium]